MKLKKPVVTVLFLERMAGFALLALFLASLPVAAEELGALGLSPGPGERYFRLAREEGPSATFLRIRAVR